MHLGLDAYAEMGYIPSDHEHESVSKTLEYAFDDACIARMAAHLNQADVETRFRRRAAHWTNLYNPASGFIQPKRKALGMKDLSLERSTSTSPKPMRGSTFLPPSTTSKVKRTGGRRCSLFGQN